MGVGVEVLMWEPIESWEDRAEFCEELNRVHGVPEADSWRLLCYLLEEEEKAGQVKTVCDKQAVERLEAAMIDSEYGPRVMRKLFKDLPSDKSVQFEEDHYRDAEYVSHHLGFKAEGRLVICDRFHHPELTPKRHVDGVWIHVHGGWFDRSAIQRFMAIEGEVCCSDFEQMNLFAYRRGWWGVVVAGEAEAVYDHDCWSIKDFRGLRCAGDRAGAPRTEAWVVPARTKFLAIVTDSQEIVQEAERLGVQAVLMRNRRIEKFRVDNTRDAHWLLREVQKPYRVISDYDEIEVTIDCSCPDDVWLAEELGIPRSQL